MVPKGATTTVFGFPKRARKGLLELAESDCIEVKLPRLGVSARSLVFLDQSKCWFHRNNDGVLSINMMGFIVGIKHRIRNDKHIYIYIHTYIHKSLYVEILWLYDYTCNNKKYWYLGELWQTFWRIVSREQTQNMWANVHETWELDLSNLIFWYVYICIYLSNYLSNLI